ncbi:hypothetical protein DL93DRAFT_2163629 [Clavulina sp. PMI_390]|nr:hypothetical protein DL93DRAFT_2163629 [Clavulina sp. PMI_390]
MDSTTSSSEAGPSTAPTAPLPLNSSKGGRASGKAWKDRTSASKRTHLSVGLRTKSWDERMRKATEAAAVKKLEKELQDEKAAEQQARTDKIRARRKAREERERLEIMKAKMSQKKLDRQRRKLGRTKKVNG